MYVHTAHQSIIEHSVNIFIIIHLELYYGSVWTTEQPAPRDGGLN